VVIGTSFVNQGGTVRTNSGLGQINFVSGYTQSAGFIVNNSVMQTANFIINGGVVQGAGSYLGNVIMNAGTIAPGNSVGSLTINGDLLLGGNSTLFIELGGTGVGEYDLLTVLGNTTYDGTLQLGLDGSYIGFINDIFQPITSSSTIGQFVSLKVPAGYGFIESYISNVLGLTVTKTPNFDVNPIDEIVSLLDGNTSLVEEVTDAGNEETEVLADDEGEENDAVVTNDEEGDEEEILAVNYCR